MGLPGSIGRARSESITLRTYPLPRSAVPSLLPTSRTLNVANANGQHVVFQSGMGGEQSLRTPLIAVGSKDGIRNVTRTRSRVREQPRSKWSSMPPRPGSNNSVWSVAAGNEGLDPDAVGAVTLLVVVTVDSLGNQYYTFTEMNKKFDSYGRRYRRDRNTTFLRYAGSGAWPPGVVALTKILAGRPYICRRLSRFLARRRQTWVGQT